MYDIYGNIWGILMVNVTVYTIHGSYGILKTMHVDIIRTITITTTVTIAITTITTINRAQWSPKGPAEPSGAAA